MLTYDEFDVEYIGKDLPADQYKKDVLRHIEKKGVFIDKCFYVARFHEDDACSVPCAQLRRLSRLRPPRPTCS